MAVDMFLKIEGIDGVSPEQSIEISSFSWGVSNPGSASAGGGGGGASSRAVFQDLSVTKRIDKSSPLLYLTCASGEHIRKATLTVARCASNADGTASSTSLEYKLTDCIISATKPSGGSTDPSPAEEVSFNFAKIEWTYKAADGSAVRTGWDLKKNTKA